MTAAHKVLQLSWYVRRPRTYGAHALALTPQRKIVLVKLRYAHGWRVPGGGRSPDEDPVAAALRELREEIGMMSHGRVRVVGEEDDSIDYKRDRSTLLIVEDVRYRPRRWSLEVERVGEFDLADLPEDTHHTTRRWVAQLAPGS